jgi:hypothetical protein
LNSKIPMVPRVALVDLAKAVDRLLKMQADYFRTKNPQKLRESKDAERRLGDAVKDIIARPEAQATLWAEAHNVADDALGIVAANRLRAMVEELRAGKGDRPSTIRSLLDLAAMLQGGAAVNGGAR